MSVPAVLRDVAQIGASCAGRGRHAGLLLAVLLLAGCPGTTMGPGGLDGTSPNGRAAAAPPVPKPKPVRKANEAAVAALPMPEPGPPVTSADFPPAPAAGSQDPAGAANATSPATANADPDALVGLDEVQTLHLLGSPVAREEAPPAKIWRYSKGDCTLKVFFFMDMTSSQDFRALSYDMKSSQNVPDADHRCFAQLLAQADTGRPDRAGFH